MDRELAGALSAVEALEARVQVFLHDNPEPAECQAAMLVARQAASLRGPLERWIAKRAVLAEERRRAMVTT